MIRFVFTPLSEVLKLVTLKPILRTTFLIFCLVQNCAIMAQIVDTTASSYTEKLNITISTTENDIFLRLSGFNILSKNVWESPTFHYHASKAIEYSQQFGSNKTLAYTSTTLGFLSLGTGISLNYFEGGGTELMIIGGIGLMAGIYLLNRAFEHKNLMDYHLFVLDNYYRKDELY